MDRFLLSISGRLCSHHLLLRVYLGSPHANMGCLLRVDRFLLRAYPGEAGVPGESDTVIWAVC